MTRRVDLVGPAPWGFRISGGRDFHTPIVVTKVTERGKAEAADLRPGDIIVAINEESTEDMLHAQAQSKIRQSPSPLRLQLDPSRAMSPGCTNGDGSAEARVSRFQGSPRTPMGSQSFLYSSCSNLAPLSPLAGGPFSNPSSPQPVEGETVIRCSIQSPVRTARPPAAELTSYEGNPKSHQASWGRAEAVRVLPSPPPGPSLSSRRLSADLLDEDSEVYKMLQENREARAPPRQSSSFRLLQEALEAEERDGVPAVLPSSLSPSSSQHAPQALGTPHRLHTCEKCGTSIATQAVRIQEGRFRHPGCYTCSDCGLNLKMRGHFWVGDELFCEKHARQRYVAPAPRSLQA